MDNSRMSTADMLQYCNEALAWDDFGPIDIYFFESVKKIILGECAPFDAPDEDIDDLMGIERPVSVDELAPDYDKYADDYYEDGEGAIEAEKEDDSAFTDEMFAEGFFDDNDKEDEQSAENNDGTEALSEETSGGSFTVNV